MLCLPLTSACSLAQPYLLKIAIDRFIAQGDRARPAAHGHALRPRHGGRVRLPLPAVLSDDARRAAQPRGPARRPRHPPAGAADDVLRPQSGRAPRHPAHHRRRRDQRDVRRRRAHDPHGRRHAARHRRHHDDDRLAPRRRHPGGSAGRGGRDQLLPREGARELPPHPRPPGAPQRLSAGSALGHDGHPALRARSAEPAALRSARTTSSATPTTTRTSTKRRSSRSSRRSARSRSR